MKFIAFLFNAAAVLLVVVSAMAVINRHLPLAGGVLLLGAAVAWLFAVGFKKAGGGKDGKKSGKKHAMAMLD